MAIDLNLEGSFISLALERPHNEFTSKRKLQSPLFFLVGEDFSQKMLLVFSVNLYLRPSFWFYKFCLMVRCCDTELNLACL